MDDAILKLSRAVDAVRSSKEPNWLALEALLPQEWWDGWMFMDAPVARIYNAGTCPRDARGAPLFDQLPRMQVFLYKHGITRRYLNIGADLRCYVYCPSFCDIGDPVYKRISTEHAISVAYEGLEQLGATRSTAYNAEYVAERNRRLIAAGYTVVG